MTDGLRLGTTCAVTMALGVTGACTRRPIKHLPCGPPSRQRAGALRVHLHRIAVPDACRV